MMAREKSARDYFAGRNAVIATRHGKEKVMAPWMLKVLGLYSFATEQLDTDSFGTFSGEVERKGDPVEVLRKKCLAAMDIHQVEIGIANEGSFGPHPAAYFANADEEWMIFIDRKNGWEIVERVVSLATNFNAGTFSDWNEIESFANSVQFPSHGLIAKADQLDGSGMEKGIVDWERLRLVGEKFLERKGQVYLETDMRAMFNPTRMLVIEDAVKKLLEKVNTLCEECGTPGFGISWIAKGLPCAACRNPTSSTLKHFYSCTSCDHQAERLHPHGKSFENPMYCDVCNP